MEERSDYSVKSVKKSTKRVLSGDDVLEILQAAVLMARKHGIEIKVSPLFYSGRKSVVLVLEDVKLDGGKLVMGDAINGNVPVEIADEHSGGRPPRKERVGDE